MHAALERFLKAYPAELPSDALDRLIEIGAEVFHPIRAKPGAYAFWWPRFLRVAQWFLAEEQARRAGIAESFVEIGGKLTFDAPFAPFTLTAKADRIDRMSDGALEIIDYKTGAPPEKKKVDRGFAPQLPLEAAIALEGGFAGLPQGPVGSLAFWRLSGGTPPGEVQAASRTDPAELAAQAIEGLKRLVARFDDPATPYACRPRPEMAPRFSDYDHLSRLAEWAVGPEGE